MAATLVNSFCWINMGRLSAVSADPGIRSGLEMKMQSKRLHDSGTRPKQFDMLCILQTATSLSISAETGTFDESYSHFFRRTAAPVRETGAVCFM